MSIFGQVWLWSVVAFFAGALLAWLWLARPAQARARALERRLEAAQAAASERRSVNALPTRTFASEPGLDEPESVNEHLRPGQGQPQPAASAESNWHGRDTFGERAPEAPVPESDAERTSIFSPYQNAEHGSLFDGNAEADRGGLFDANAGVERGALFDPDAEVERGALFDPAAEAGRGRRFESESAAAHGHASLLDQGAETGHRYAGEPDVAAEHGALFPQSDEVEPEALTQSAGADDAAFADGGGRGFGQSTAAESAPFVHETAGDHASHAQTADGEQVFAQSDQDGLGVFDRQGIGTDLGSFDQPGSGPGSFDRPSGPEASSAPEQEQHGSLFAQDEHHAAEVGAAYGSHAATDEAPPAYAFGGDIESHVAEEKAAESTAVLPRRQPRSTPSSDFEPPKPSVRSIERREPVADEGGRTGSLFEPAVRRDVRPGAHAVAEPAPTPPPARAPVADGAVPPGPFGPGSAMPRPGGGSPSEEFTVKASVTALRYCTAESPQYNRMVAEVWFRTAADAERVGFRPLP